MIALNTQEFVYVMDDQIASMWLSSFLEKDKIFLTRRETLFSDMITA